MLAVFAIVCMSSPPATRPSVSPSQVGVLMKQPNKEYANYAAQ